MSENFPTSTFYRGQVFLQTKNDDIQQIIATFNQDPNIIVQYAVATSSLRVLVRKPPVPS